MVHTQKNHNLAIMRYGCTDDDGDGDGDGDGGGDDDDNDNDDVLMMMFGVKLTYSSYS